MPKEKRNKPVTKMRDGARWIISQEAADILERMRKEEHDRKIATARH